MRLSRPSRDVVIHRIRSRNGARLATPLQAVVRRSRCVHDLRTALLVPDRRLRSEGHRTGDATNARRVRGGRHEWGRATDLLGAQTVGGWRCASLGLSLAVDSIAGDRLGKAEKSE